MASIINIYGDNPLAVAFRIMKLNARGQEVPVTDADVAPGALTLLLATAPNATVPVAGISTALRYLADTREWLAEFTHDQLLNSILLPIFGPLVAPPIPTPYLVLVQASNMRGYLQGAFFENRPILLLS